MSEGNHAHPVWDVYNEYRTARLNVLYYTGLLHRFRDRDFWIEVSLAVVAPTSAVAGFAFWNTEWGAVVWKVFGVGAAVIALVKPFLKLTDKIAKLEEIIAGYRALDHDLRCLEIKIHRDGAYTDEHKAALDSALAKKQALVTQSPIFPTDKALRRECEGEVMNQLPAESFYVPEAGGKP